ncbi:tape measure protein [Gordonia phage Gravy]|uniref:Tape measure protein n=2 Tax=Tanisvirus tanis TaxID=2844677 RepID=A0A2P1JYG9_9CAUD|nr:tape measure protein [Gordonia phage Gravy]AVO25362.1 tape measure protein [Gordonia phage Kerry]
MAVVDDLIVAMQFDNSRFESAVRVSLATLTHLKSSLQFGGGPNGIDAAQKSIEGFSAAPMSSQIDGVSAKFLALSTIAVTALSNITNKVIDAGSAMAKSLTVTPIMDGFSEYETKIGSIQTIFANTRKNYKDQATALSDITANLDELNTYADDTIYSFGDMTKNIGLFTNAGIGVGDATAMIKGFSNEAAASGTTSQGAAGAAYQLSQALSAGVITLMDWKSLSNVGMGNDNMKQGIIQIAEAMGAFEGTTVTAEEASKNFNSTLEKKWLTSDVMENYLKIQAEGNEDVSRAMMKQIGLTDKQADAFIEQQKTSEDAARKVRTWTQLVGTLREGIGSSWASTFDILLGDFDSATTLFTGISDTLGGMVSKFSASRNELLQGWADLGGRDVALEGLKNIFEGLMSVLRPIKDAFREIFPPTTAQSLMAMTVAFRDFTENLKVGSETANNIKRTFAGVFAIFGIGATIVKAILGVFVDLFSAVTGGSGGFLSVTASLGDFLVKIHEGLKSSEGFKNFFAGLGAILAVPIQLFSTLAAGVGAFMMKLGDLGGVVSQVYGILGKGDFRGGPFDEDSKVVDVLFRIREALVWVSGALEQFWNVLAKGDFVGGGPFAEDSPIIDGLFKFREMMSKFFEPGNVSAIFGAGAIAAVAYGLSRVVKGAIAKFTGEDGGILGELKGAFTAIKDSFESVTGVFDKLTDALTVMQTNVKANIILKIAVAVGILALALKLLATMDVPSLVKSLSAVVVAVTILVTALAIISKMASLPGIVNMPLIALALIGLAAAVLILSAAMKVMATMSWEELAKGLTGLAVALGLMVAASYGMGKASGPLLRAGLAMIPFAAGVRLLVLSIQAMSTMSWGDLAKGMAGLAGSLLIIANAMKIMPKNLPAIGAGLILVSVGVLGISTAIRAMGGMDTGTMVQGLIGMGAALVIIAGALQLMPKNLPSMALSLLGVSIALGAVAGVVMSLGSMGWGDLAKGLIGLAGALLILSVAMYAMSGAMAGALALTVAAAGLTLLMIPLQIMANMSWQEMLMGLGMLAGTLTILGLAGYLLAPVAPIIIALGIGMGALGIGLLAVGAAALVFGLALKTIIEVVMLGQTAMLALLTFIPQLAIAFATAIASFIIAIANNTGAIMAAFGKLLTGLLNLVITLIPKISEVISRLLTAVIGIIIEFAPQWGEAFLVLIDTWLNVLTTAIPRIADAGMQIIIGLLQVIRDRIPEVASTATDIVVAFINSLNENLQRIIQAGVDFIVNFLNGLAQGIRENIPRVSAAAREVGKAIIDGIVQAIKDGLGDVLGAAKDIASSALNAAKNFLGIRSPSKKFYELGEWTVVGFTDGIDSKNSLAAKTANNFATGFMAGFSKGIGKELPKTLDYFYDSIERSSEEVLKATRSMSNGFDVVTGSIWQAELAMAELAGQVNRSDPKSVEAYVEKVGGKLVYLKGVIDAVKESSEEMFKQLSEGKGLDEVLGSEAFLGTVLNGVLSAADVIGAATGQVEVLLVTMGIRLALAVVDGILSIFMGPGTTVLGIIGEWIQKLVRAVGGWFGIKFPVADELKEGDKALEDFMAKVDEGNGRFQRLSEDAVKSLTDQMNEADDLANGIEDMDPTVRPILDLNGWNKQINDFLDSLDTGPVVLNSIIDKLTDILGDPTEILRDIFNPVKEPASTTTNVTLNQTNESPKALDHVEIYRQTKSQLSLAKEALGIS